MAETLIPKWTVADRIRKAREVAAAAEQEKKHMENRIKAVLGEAGAANGDGWSLRYAVTKTGSRPFVLDHEKEKDGKAA